MFGSATLVLGLGVALIDGGNFVMALLCIVSYGIANGLKAVQRATLPLALFGRGQFGAYMGRLALPQGIVSASAPPVIAGRSRQLRHGRARWVIFCGRPAVARQHGSVGEVGPQRSLSTTKVTCRGPVRAAPQGFLELAVKALRIDPHDAGCFSARSRRRGLSGRSAAPGHP